MVEGKVACSVSVGTRTTVDCAHLQRKDGYSPLRDLSISEPLSKTAKDLHAIVYILRTNHSTVALSRVGSSGLWLRTKANVVPSKTSNPPTNMPSRVVTDH